MFRIARDDGGVRRWYSLAILLAVVLLALMTGCTSRRMTQTPRSRTEQELLILAFERAVSQLDVQNLTGRRVGLEMYGLLKDDVPYAKEYVSVWLSKHGVQVVRDQREVDLRLKAFAKVLAVDQTEILVGTPEFTFLGIPIPSIAIYRNVRNRGRAEMQIFAFDEKTETLVGEVPGGTGDSKDDRYTVLFVVSWTKSDLEQKPEQKNEQKNE